MPIRFAILKSYNLLYVHYAGNISLADIEAALPLLLNDSDFNPSLWQLVDMREANLSALSYLDLRRLTASTNLQPGVKRAAVASSDLGYGISRMIEALIEPHSHHVQVFRSMENACQWLGVPIDALPDIGREDCHSRELVIRRCPLESNSFSTPAETDKPSHRPSD